MRRHDSMPGANAAYLQLLHDRYRQDGAFPDSTTENFFASLETETYPSDEAVSDTSNASPEPVKGVFALVHAYREVGHFVANLDPLNPSRENHPLLDLSEFGLSTSDLDKRVGSAGFRGPCDGTFRDLIEKLRITYCGTFGVEYTGISDKNQQAWLEQRMEPILNHPRWTPAERKRFLAMLTRAEMFEQYLQLKYLGHKRFSVEGGESLVVLLDTLVETGVDLGVEEMVFGMGHRGRLNVLAHLIDKPYELILHEFEGTAQLNRFEGDGDVKYHLGYSHDRVNAEGKSIHLSLTPNPSHLELVNPVIEGIVRAKQEARNDVRRKRVVPIQIHGDAAFTGQGVVSETLSLSELKGYHTGGTIHIIVNNNLGFTATPSETRFTPYPTAVGKMIQAPIFHVNADDPEAVGHVARMAMAFRQQFKVDVLIDLWCYRRYGHNETDDASFTQPLLYRDIANHKTARELYEERLLDEKIVTPEDVEAERNERLKRLDTALKTGRTEKQTTKITSLGGVWKDMTFADDEWSADTTVSLDVIQRIGERATEIPPNFTVYSKLKRLLKARHEMTQGKQSMDWGCAEMCAFGSLLLEGHGVRVDGQDCQRGTFSHRHAVWHDAATGKKYAPLAHLAEGQPYFVIHNSMLSETAVLGFAYGISSADPHRLVIWEAQFGDFANVAQPIIDQFIVSAESKWQRMSGIVLLLPHGQEGQGPEHSSARLERFLSLCAEKNIQVVYPSTPAQLFHALRRQMHRSFRKPMIVMTPKSLLRNKRCVSELSDLTNRSFQNVIEEPVDRKSVRRLLLCTGKMFYDLTGSRDMGGKNEVGIVRIEQLYPFPESELKAILEKYPPETEICWVQEEPQNMGAWTFFESRYRRMRPDAPTPTYFGRKAAASPATGSQKTHQAEQAKITQLAWDV